MNIIKRNPRGRSNDGHGIRAWSAVRRLQAALFAAAIALLGNGLYHAEGASTGSDLYPDRPVRLLVPFAVGRPSDLIARLIAQKLSDELGNQFYVENRPGSAGNIGTGIVAHAPADGYTILLTGAEFMINPSLDPGIPYDPVNDFDPVTVAAATPNVLVVHPSVQAKTVRELIALVRAGKYDTLAQPGTGSPPHMSAELFKSSLNLNMVSVPFNGGGSMIQCIVAGHTPVGFSALPSALGQIEGGLLRALAVTRAERISLLPDVPTLAEAGVPDQEADAPQAVLVPAGTPKPIISLLYRSIREIVHAPEVRDRLSGLGFEPVAMTPAQFETRIRTDIRKWGRVIRGLHLTPE